VIAFAHTVDIPFLVQLVAAAGTVPFLAHIPLIDWVDWIVSSMPVSVVAS
jgi:hypothetical protein